MRTITTCVALLTISVSASVLAVQDTPSQSNSLKAAVAEFNKKSSSHSIGKTQPPLTEAEVVAAIRGWIPKTTPGVTDEVFEQFQEIAESETLPDGAELSFCPGWRGYRGFHFTVWWIDLSIKTGEKTGYTFRIRDQKIASRKMTPEEVARAKVADK